MSKNQQWSALFLVIGAFFIIGCMIGASPAQIYKGTTTAGSSESITLENTGNLQTRLSDFTLQPHNYWAGFSQLSFNPSVVPNDFGVMLSDYSEIPYIVSADSVVYSEDVKLVFPFNTYSLYGNSYNTYNVKRESTLLVSDDLDSVKSQCVVWDTCGHESSSLWERVFDESHIFKGNCVISNGLFGVLIDYSTCSIRPYNSDFLSLVCDWGDTSHFVSFSLDAISLDVVSFTVVPLEYPSHTMSFEITTGICGYKVQGDGFVWFFDGFQFPSSFVVTEANDVWIPSLESTSRSIVYNNSWVVSFDEGLDSIHIVSNVRAFDGSKFVIQLGPTNRMHARVYPYADSLWLADTIVPISDISQVIWTWDMPSSFTIGGSTYIGSDAYGGSAFRVPVGESSSSDFMNYGNMELLEGSYVSIIRAKAVDVDSSIWTGIIDNHVGIESPLGYSSFDVPSSKWNTYAIPFTISSANKGHTIRQKLDVLSGGDVLTDVVLVIPVGLIEEVVDYSYLSLNSNRESISPAPIYNAGLSVSGTPITYPESLSGSWAFSNGRSYLDGQEITLPVDLPLICPGFSSTVSIEKDLDYSLTYIPKNMAVHMSQAEPGQSIQVLTQLQDTSGNPASYQPTTLRARLIDGAGNTLLDQEYGSTEFTLPGNLFDLGYRELRLSYEGWEFGGWSNEIVMTWDVGQEGYHMISDSRQAPDQSIVEQGKGLLYTVLHNWESQDFPLISDFCTWLIQLLNLNTPWQEVPV